MDMQGGGPLPPRPHRFNREVEVRLREVGRPDLVLGRASHSINISSNGLLAEIPGELDAVGGQEVSVRLTWDGGSFETTATIVRFDSPYRGDPARQAMALQLKEPIPHELFERPA
ncbi:MAG TPA: hypothetical protein VMT21_04035 [Gemmatimonadales bacterium]|nr:hypothetical protein [Gemmatimonadales bacterium]